MEFSHGGGSVPASHSGKIIIPYEPEPRMPEKWCYRCRKFKIYDEFHRKASHYDGYSGECKLCDNAIMNESREKKRGKVS